MISVRAALALRLAGVTSGEARRASAPAAVMEMLRRARGRQALAGALGRPLVPVDWDEHARQLEGLARIGAGAVSWWDPDYPEWLREIADAPPLILYRGDPGAIARRGIAVVGTRKPTPGGVAMARRLGSDLAAVGVAVVSGMARGIDTAAHTGSLEGPGPAVAVVGTGLDVPYPPENAGLLVDVARRGCVVTEQLLGMHAEPWVFPRRNRLISAASHAVVVVEGGLKSGALITARWALEQGRDVGAVPGFPGDFRSAGPNELIRQGAFVVEDVRDVFDAVPVLRPPAPRAPSAPGEGAGGGEGGGLAARVMGSLGSAPQSPDAVAEVLGVEVAAIQGALAELEIDGRVARDASGRYTRS